MKTELKKKAIFLRKTTVASLEHQEMNRVFAGNTRHSMDDCDPTFVSDGLSCKTDGTV